MTIQRLLTGILLFVVSVSATVLNERKFCRKYFGSVRAELEVADAIPKFNYNGTIICPRSYDLPTVSGAVLEICPADNYQNDGTVLTASLRLSPLRLLGLPINGLKLDINLITNGSVTGPFENNGQPAVLAKDDGRSKRFEPVWTINGTQGSLNDYPSANSTALGVFFNCENTHVTTRYRYCGDYDDRHSGGCWSRQLFHWSMQRPLNYTIRLSLTDAVVEIHTADEYTYTDQNRNLVSTGSYTRAFLKFGGVPHVPSVVDYDFWINAEQDYEAEVAYHNDIRLVEDATGMPVFVNNSDKKEWYAAKNGTFSEEEQGSSVRNGVGVALVIGTVLTGIGMLLL